MKRSWVRGVGLTSFGRHQGSTTLSLMNDAVKLALRDAGLERRDIDSLFAGYSTTMPHLMLANVFAEQAAIQPGHCQTMQVGGATGLAMIGAAHGLVGAGRARNVLVVAGENRLSGQTRNSAITTLAQVGHPSYEVPLGATVPAYYALLASSYYHAYGVTEEDSAALPVLMRSNAVLHPGAHLRTPLRTQDVLASKPIALPLRLFDCCPLSDGAAAVIIATEPNRQARVHVRAIGQANKHQHLSEATDIDDLGAKLSLSRAEADGSVSVADVAYAGIYDSFTSTLMILLEELGLAPRGRSGSFVREGYFSRDGPCPLNTHGGLLSYGHSGVAGGMAYFVETFLQMSGRAEDRQISPPALSLVHADGGVMSAHVSAFLERL